jgi:hypothetical protein
LSAWDEFGGGDGSDGERNVWDELLEVARHRASQVCTLSLVNGHTAYFVEQGFFVREPSRLNAHDPQRVSRTDKNSSIGAIEIIPLDK